MPAIDLRGLGSLAQSLTDAADGIRADAAGCTRALAGLDWRSGISGAFGDVSAGAVRRATAAAEELDRIAAALRRQDAAVEGLTAEAAGVLRAAWHAVGSVL